MTAPKITPTYLAELRKLADNASSGPWEQDIMGYWKVYGPDDDLHVNLSVNNHGITRPFINATNNAAFIAASRTAIPALLEHIEKLEAMMPKQCGTCVHYKYPKLRNEWGCCFENNDGSIEQYLSLRGEDARCINGKWQLKEVK